MAENKELMTIKEAMQLLRVSRSSIYRLVSSGHLTPIKLGPFILRFQRTEVEGLARRGIGGRGNGTG